MGKFSSVCDRVICPRHDNAGSYGFTFLLRNINRQLNGLIQILGQVWKGVEVYVVSAEPVFAKTNQSVHSCCFQFLFNDTSTLVGHFVPLPK